MYKPCITETGMTTHPDVNVFLGRGLVELEAEGVRELLAPLEADNPLVLHVALVSHQDHLRVVPRIRLDLGAPEFRYSFIYVVYWPLGSLYKISQMFRGT